LLEVFGGLHKVGLCLLETRARRTKAGAPSFYINKLPE
jgi:hypothetical protein